MDVQRYFMPSYSLEYPTGMKRAYDNSCGNENKDKSGPYIPNKRPCKKLNK